MLFLQEIAAKFKEESGVEARSMEGMGERLDIRKFILAGRVREAIEKTNHVRGVDLWTITLREGTHLLTYCFLCS
jgi:hypothetical protein